MSKFDMSRLIILAILSVLLLAFGGGEARAEEGWCGNIKCPSGFFCSPQTITCVVETTGAAICEKTHCSSGQVCNPATGACEVANMCCFAAGAHPACLKKSSSAELCQGNRQEVNCNLYPAECGAPMTAPSGEEEVKFQPVVPSLLINIPGFKGFTNQGLTGADLEGYVYPPFIGQYIGAVYKWAILIGGLVATIIIIYGGFMYLVSRGNSAAIDEAKTRIKGALLGLFLILGSYSLLYLINPNLVRFENLKILAIKPEFVGEEEAYLTDEENTSGQSVLEVAGLTDVPQTNFIEPRGNKARGDVVSALQKAIEEYDGPVSVNAGTRTAAQQWALVKKYCGCKDESQIPADVAMGQWQSYCVALKNCRASYKKLGRQGGNFTLASTTGHAVGNALDINATGGSYIGCQNATNEEKQSRGAVYAANLKVGDPCVPKNQQKLIRAMIRAGFCVGLKSGSTIRESWHFELTTNGLPLSPFCVKELSDSNLQKLYYLQNEE